MERGFDSSVIAPDEKGDIFNKLVVQKSVLILLMVMQLVICLGSFTAQFKVSAELGYYSGLASFVLFCVSIWGLIATLKYESKVHTAQYELRLKEMDDEPIKLDESDTTQLLVLYYILQVFSVIIFACGVIHLFLRGESLAQVRAEYFF